MPDLASFQRGFSRAIMSDAQPAPSLRSHALAVYRNTSARGAVEALRATFSTVNQLLGEDGFTQVALDYRDGEPPSGPVLSDYGGSFPEYLANQPWTSELPYLADVARLDWLWLESFLAGGLETLPRPIAGHSRIMLHPAARFIWLATPGLTIWQAHRDGFDELQPDWCEEGALFTRPGLQVRVQPIERACHYLLLLGASSIRVDQCVSAVAEAYPQSNVPELLQSCVAAGALIIR
ncbi:MAG TPA: DNA-binding domain-containing protein [Sphingomicrobium sp.]|nr:DNA-binding domain-containing protein [Sphingomicrobium sp.]